MRIISGALALIVLSASLAGAQPARQAPTPARPSGAGIVKTVTGAWVVEIGTTRRPLRAGDEIPNNVKLIAEGYDGKGPDTRAITIGMFDTSNREFRCAQPSVCDAPIPISIDVSSISSYVRDILRALFGREEKVTPLIIGKAEQPAAIVPLKDGQIEVTLTGTLRGEAIDWCAVEGPTECLKLTPARRRGFLGTSEAVTVKAREGLYTLRNSNTGRVVLAVDPDRYRDATARFNSVSKSEALSALDPDKKRLADVLVLQLLSDDLLVPVATSDSLPPANVTTPPPRPARAK